MMRYVVYLVLGYAAFLNWQDSITSVIQTTVQVSVVAMLGLIIMFAVLVGLAVVSQLVASNCQPASNGRLYPSRRPIPVYHRNYPYHR